MNTQYLYVYIFHLTYENEIIIYLFMFANAIKMYHYVN